MARGTGAGTRAGAVGGGALVPACGCCAGGGAGEREVDVDRAGRATSAGRSRSSKSNLAYSLRGTDRSSIMEAQAVDGESSAAADLGSLHLADLGGVVLVVKAVAQNASKVTEGPFKRVRDGLLLALRRPSLQPTFLSRRAQA